MKNNFDKNWKLINIFTFFFFFLATPFPVAGSEEQVKYFGKMECRHIFNIKIDVGCEFYDEQDAGILEEIGGYHKVSFKGDIPTQETHIFNDLIIGIYQEPHPRGPNPIVVNKRIFDSKGRITIAETMMYSPEDYRLCKYSYRKQIIEIRCYDKKRKFVSNEISDFKGKMMVENWSYDESGNLMKYATYNHKTFRGKVFSPDHKLIDEINMMSYFH